MSWFCKAPLENKVALTTGAIRDIGLGVAQKFASEGMNLILNYSSDEQAAQEAAGAMASYDVDFMMLKADASDSAAIHKMFEDAIDRLGNLDVVVANAGIEMVETPFTDYTGQDFDKVFNLNVRGTFFVMQQAPRRVSDGGRIILMSSNQSVNAETGAAIYAASKAASKKFVEILSKEMSHRNVTVNSIMPGVIDNAGVIANISEDFKQLVRDNSSFGRLGTPEDVAKVAAFLASDEAAYINGHHLKANGGSEF